MLTLSRDKYEEIVIVYTAGVELRFHIADVRGRTVRIGFDMPKEARIYRAEVYERIKEEGPHPILEASAERIP